VPTEAEWQLRFEHAQNNPSEVVLEGIHALKHAIRFGAEVHHAVTSDREALLQLAGRVAPDLVPRIGQMVRVVSPECFAQLTRRPPGSPVLSIAAVPPANTAGFPTGLGVVLFEPRHAGNAGAVIRVAAAAGASAVLVTGPMNVWSTPVVRAAAGLHYALEVANVQWPLELSRPVIAFDPDEGDTDHWSIPDNALLVFGGERDGLPPAVLNSADRTLRIPMRSGVSSLNLATSVAVALYSRLKS
jgi:RNA methyltransferase, TrmH family